MTRGPFKLETRGKDLAERIAWWNGNGGQVATPRKRERLSLVWKTALRQDWGMD